jgi:HAD superfamily hydrolase (TIGR01450 family)
VRTWAQPQDATHQAGNCNDHVAMINTVLCDLDGVIWLAHQPIAGSVEAVATLRHSGRRVVFVTNNSSATVDTQERALADIGIPAVGDVVTSAMAAALLVVPGERVLVAGGPGLVEAMERRGATVVVNDGLTEPGAIDVVVTGLHRDFDYRRLAVAATALHRGARLVGTNPDPTYPTPDGLDPGGGAILAAIAVAGGVEPQIAGKPHAPMAQLIALLLADVGVAFQPERVLMVGDRVDTDGAFAAELGCRFALVRSGSTRLGDVVAGLLPESLDLDDLAAVAGGLTEGRIDQPPLTPGLT